MEMVAKPGIVGNLGRLSPAVASAVFVSESLQEPTVGNIAVAVGFGLQSAISIAARVGYTEREQFGTDSPQQVTPQNTPTV